jgi:hypothetical protein
VFTPPPREVLLAARSPAELFGASALDARALRRAWASLARAFRAEDDPEAFQHARALYEAARDGGEAAPSEADSSTPAAPSPPLPAADDLLEQAKAALATGDLQAGVTLLTERGDELMVRYTGAGAILIRAVLHSLGPQLDPASITTLRRLIDRGDVDLDPRFVRGATFDCLMAEAIHRGRAAAPSPGLTALVTLCEVGWRRRTDEVAASWLPLLTPPNLAALDAARPSLERDHATLLGYLRRRILEVEDTVGAPEEPPETAAWRPRLAPAVLVEVEVSEAVRAALHGFVSRVVLYLVGVLVIRAVAPGVHTLLVILGALVLRWVFAAALIKRLPPLLLRLRPRVPPAQADLLACCRASALFPRELATLLAPTEPIPLGAPDVSYEEGHPLLALEADPFATLRVLTPAHVDRLAAVYAQEPSDA